MNHQEIIELKERIALSESFTPQERDFVLSCINTTIEGERSRVSVTVMDSPANYMGRIDALWVALSIDEGGEGLCAAPFGEMTLPLIAADKRRLDQIVPVAQAIAKMFRKPVRLVKFTTREDIEIYQP